MSIPLSSIYRDIRRLLVLTEDVVRRFARYHKYTVGSQLRTQGMALMRGVNRACFDAEQQAQHGQALVWLAKPACAAGGRPMCVPTRPASCATAHGDAKCVNGFVRVFMKTAVLIESQGRKR